MSNFPSATVKDMHNMCLVAKNLGKIAPGYDLYPVDESVLLPSKLTEMKWYDKIDPENSFPHQPIERWCASTNPTPSPWETNQVRKQILDKWQFGADGPVACPHADDQPRVAVGVTDDGLIADAMKASKWFYRINPEVSPKVIPQYLTGTTTTYFTPDSGPLSTRTFRVRIDLIHTLIHGEHIELDLPHDVVITMPHDSHSLVGRVVAEKKRDATPHNRYLGPDNLGVIEAVCPQAMAFIVRVPHNKRLSFITFWDAQFLGELSACGRFQICNDERPFVTLTQDGGFGLNFYFNDDHYNWMNIGWASGSPYDKIYNSDDFIEFLPSHYKEAVLQLNWCFYNFWILLHHFEYYQVRADGFASTSSASRISKDWAG